MECPFIDKGFVPNPRFNTPVNYRDLGGPIDYTFYDHTMAALVKKCAFSSANDAGANEMFFNA